MECRLGEDVCENKMLDSGKMKNHENEVEDNESKSKNKVDGIENMESRLRRIYVRIK